MEFLNQRRRVLHSLSQLGMATLALGLGACAHSPTNRTVFISMAQIQSELAKSFPKNLNLATWLSLSVLPPSLQMLPVENRISASMVIEATGLALPQRKQGVLELSFALRYEPSDNTLRASQLMIKRLHVSGLPPAATELVRRYGQGFIEKSLVELVLYTLRPDDVVNMNRLGMRPGTIRVTDAGLLFDLKPKP